jgi:radical SAM superfamily enzyme YgiQ (UPF0313 family)
VATHTHPISLGLRYVSAYLKQHGHQVQMIFMSSRRDTPKPDFSPALLGNFVDRLREADLIGMSLMTNTFVRACVLTEAIRKAGLKTPVIWGGTHPTVAPDESIEVADMVCVGEGERPMQQLAETLDAGRDPAGVESLILRREAQITRNPVAPLENNLDALPFPDYDLDTQWLASKDELVPARPELMRGALHRYRVETTRGCPFKCSFCNNSAQMEIARGKGKWVRLRSNENVIAELEQICSRFPTIEEVNVIDDLFFVRNATQMGEFARAYAERVNLPIELDAHPNNISRDKIEALSPAPIALISMGIQSGSPDTLRSIYNRPTSIETIAQGIRTLSEARIKAEYHYLVDNPFESDASRIETLRFAATHHRGPAILRIFPLQFYPGAPLYDRARAEGVIGQRHESAYHYMYTGKKYLKQAAYLEIWLRVVLALRGKGVPRPIVHGLVGVVVHPWVRWALDRRWFAPASYRLWRIAHVTWKNLIYQPFVKPFRYLRRRGAKQRRPGPRPPTSAASRNVPIPDPAPQPASTPSQDQPREPVQAGPQ